MGSFIVGNTGKTIKATLKALPSCLKGAKYKKDNYMELMALLYELLGKVRKEGLMSIENDVEIGANCAIDRAKFGTTRIGTGTKIDNLVQVAHNVQIGPACVVVAQCGIAGSARLGQGVVLGGKVGVRDHITLHDGVQSAACACISKDVPAGTTVIGSPAVPAEQFAREQGKVRRLPSLFEQVEALAKRVEQLEATAND